MHLRQLEYLSALAREQHFARAATACHASQPALSEGIRRLEADLGNLKKELKNFEDGKPIREQQTQQDSEAAPKPAPAPVAVSHAGIGTAGFAAPGTFVLALVFLPAFVLYYFVNWKVLSFVWKIG